MQNEIDLDQAELEFEQTSGSAEDQAFDMFVGTFQEVVLQPKFTDLQRDLMKSTQDSHSAFTAYQTVLGKYLAQRLPGFSLERLRELLVGREQELDQQLSDTLLSLVDQSRFQQSREDYRRFFEEEEKYKLMTIKSTKKPESKVVKDTIFSGGSPSLATDFKKLSLEKKEKKVQRREEDVLHPDLLLTVKPLRKRA